MTERQLVTRAPASLGRVEAIHIGALSVWLSALVVGAVTAILGFRVMRQSDPALPEFAAYDGEHWRLLAGLMADRVFGVVDGVGVVCALVAGLTLALAAARGWHRASARWETAPGPGQRRDPSAGSSPGRAMPLVRVIAVLLGALLVSANVFVLRPLLGQEVRAYRDAARAGDTALALEHRTRYDGLHGIARGAQMSLAGVVLVGLLGAVVQAGGRRGEDA